MLIIMNLGLIILGLLGLFFGGNWLVDGAGRIAKTLGVPRLIIGLTIVAFGTSAPELLVSVRAAMTGSAGIALGNVIGSNIANVGLILGITGLITPIAINIILVRREIPIMIAVTVAAYGLIFDESIGRVDGIILLTGFVLFNALMVYFTVTRSDEERAANNLLDEDDDIESNSLLTDFMILAAGLVTLLIGAESTVRGAVSIADMLGIPEVIIGLTLVAFGTSLPELAASMVAAFRGQPDIAVGNVIGSNVANILLILGTTSTITTITVNQPGTFSPYQPGIITFDYPLMMLFALMMLPFALDRVLTRREATVYLLIYIGFIVLSFLIK